MNLRAKFVLASASLILIVVSGVMVSLYFSEKKKLWGEIEAQQRDDLAKLAKVCGESLRMNDELAFLNYSKTLIPSPLVTYVKYSNMDKTNTWSVDKDEFRCPSRYAISDAVWASRKFVNVELTLPSGLSVIEVTQPVSKWGFVSVGYSKAAIIKLLNETLWKTTKLLLIVGFVTIIFGFVLALVMSGALTRPIDLLMKAALDIARGKKGIQVKAETSDELGQLVHTFNTMSKELTKLDELKDDFMSHVTHELRSPLTSIIATVELLAEMPLATKDPKFRRSIDRLIYGSERLNRLVDNILDLTRMEAGKMQFDIQPVNIAVIVTEMADFFEPRAMEKGLKISAIVPPKLLLVLGDPERVRQILSNLIYNAIKFTNTGGIVVWAKEKDGAMQVGVQDTGVGIPVEQLNSVFEKFETLKDTRNRVSKPVPGSGLGLNIVKRSVAAQGGTIWVESEVDKGSTFIFTLPLAPADAHAKPTLSEASMGTPLISREKHEDSVPRPENGRSALIMDEPSEQQKKAAS
ncbi:MAG: HAMP domain-containing histidine kinase [Elusimicrobia bacterium]|nr:HAMP domain-containing histidine kinase [Candidatus Obscuribacterium magneticum]